MRLWSLHPGYLDAKGLVALWREGLLAQQVLQGRTKGYKQHPQLLRFKQLDNPVGAIADYLRGVADEARERGYAFNRNKIVADGSHLKIAVTDGQLHYEFQHLLAKLKIRSPEIYQQLKLHTAIEPHPIFVVVSGDVAPWEKIPHK
jgi:hypothetical protein